MSVPSPVSGLYTVCRPGNSFLYGYLFSVLLQQDAGLITEKAICKLEDVQRLGLIHKTTHCDFVNPLKIWRFLAMKKGNDACR